MQGYLYIGSRQALPTSVVSGGGTPAVVQATNKTGAAVAKDDKVWINENDGSYELINYYSNNRNFDVNGLPTINDITGTCTDFSTSKYLQLQDDFNPSTNPWEIQIKFNLTNVTTWQFLYNGIKDYYGVAIEVTADSVLFVELSSSTSSFTITPILGTTTLSINTDYWIKVIFTGTEYKLQLSTDGINFADEGNTVTSSLNITASAGIFGLQYIKAQPMLGTLYLKDTYININGKHWWTPYLSNVTEDTLTGTAQENIANNTTGDVSIGTAPKISALTVVPSTSQQIVNHSNVDGYKPVTVSAVTASIDSNITAENIKKDVQILGVTGSYEGSSGGNTITAINKTGAAISQGDKVWIQKQTVAAGHVATPSGGYPLNYISGISNDGNYFVYATSNTQGNMPLWYINDLETDTFTKVGDSLIYLSLHSSYPYRYSNNGSTFVSTNISGSSSTDSTSKIGENSFRLGNFLFVGYDLCMWRGTTGSSTNGIQILNTNTGVITSLTGTSISFSYALNCIATSSTEICNLSQKVKYILDRSNLTYTSNSVNSSNVSCTSPIGVTSDGKVIIAVNNQTGSSSVDTNYKTLQFISNSTTFIGWSIDMYPTRLQKIINNTTDKYFISFNPNNDILACIKVGSTTEYGFFKYSTTTEIWSEIYIDLSSVLTETMYPHGFISTTADMTRIGMPIGDSSYSNTKLRIIQLQSVSGYKYVPYNYYDITQDTLTGIASENIAVDTEGDATTVLPPELNVSIQSTQNNANIIIE